MGVCSTWMSVGVRLYFAEPEGGLFLEMVLTEQKAKRAMLVYAMPK